MLQEAEPESVEREGAGGVEEATSSLEGLSISEEHSGSSRDSTAEVRLLDHALKDALV